jgi:hypothetical protein
MTISICVKIGNMISNLHKSFTNWLQKDYIKICPKCGKNLIISYPITTWYCDCIPFNFYFYIIYIIYMICYYTSDLKRRINIYSVGV